MYQIHISSGSGCSSFERISQLQFWFSAVLFLPPLPFHFTHSETKLTKPMLPKTPNNILISEWQNGRIIFVLCFATYAVFVVVVVVLVSFERCTPKLCINAHRKSYHCTSFMIIWMFPNQFIRCNHQQIIFCLLSIAIIIILLRNCALCECERVFFSCCCCCVSFIGAHGL